MPRLILTENSGSIQDTKSVGYEIVDIGSEIGLRISFENATHSSFGEIKYHGRHQYVLPPNTIARGVVNLHVPDHSSDTVVTIFAHIEDLNEKNEYELTDVISAAFNITNYQSVNRFGGNFAIQKNYLGLDEKVAVGIQDEPNKRVVLSINDRRLSVLLGEDGKGTLSFYGKDVFGANKAKVIQKFPILAYTYDDNYTNAKFTGSFLNILPDRLATLQACDTWEDPSDCVVLSEDAKDYPEVDTELAKFTQPASDLPVTTDACDDVTATVTGGVDPCRINSYDACVLPSGQVLYVFTAQDKNDVDSDMSKINRVYLANSPGSVSVPVFGSEPSLFNSLNTGNVRTTLTPGELDIKITKDVFNIIEIAGSVVIHTSPFDGESFEIIGKRKDSGSFFITIQADINVEEPIYCVQFVYIASNCTEFSSVGIPDNLPFVQDLFGNVVAVSNPSIACSKIVDSSTLASQLYIVVQGMVEGVWQLFLYAITYQLNSSCHNVSAETNTFGWAQLTNSGENKNPKAVVDATGNLHIVWESDRTGETQLYYGVLGPSQASFVNASTSTLLDKFAEVQQMADKPHAYLDADLFSIDTTLVQFFDPVYSEFNWASFFNNSGSISIIQDDNIRIVGNATADEAIVFTSMEEGTDFAWNNGLVDQLNYQINFDLKNNNDLQVIDAFDSQRLFDQWAGKFTPVYDQDKNNITCYSFGSNKMMIGRRESIYDRIVPIAGSYRNPQARIMKRDGIASTSDDFFAVLSDTNQTVRHFVLALMPEKVQFKATNTQSVVEFADDNNLSLDEAADQYLAEDNSIVNTGRYRLAILLASQNHTGNPTDANAEIVRRFSEPFNLLENKNFKILVNYVKMNKEDVESTVSKNLLSSITDDLSRFWTSVTILLDEQVVFAESFMTDLSNIYRSFDIGIGIPGGGQHITNANLPYESNVYDDLDVDLEYSNIVIGVPAIKFNKDVINLPERLRDQINMVSTGTTREDVSISFFDNNNLTSMGLPMLGTIGEFPQIPITVAGLNQSVDITVGLGNDVHLAWQSNRDNFWNIFYTSALQKHIPFRNETKITNTESNSVAPSIAVSSTGERMVTWHDNRDGLYQIYGAVSLGSAASSIDSGDDTAVIDESVCRDRFRNDDSPVDDPRDLCQLSFEFCLEGCCGFSSSSSASSASSASSSSSDTSSASSSGSSSGSSSSASSSSSSSGSSSSSSSASSSSSSASSSSSSSGSSSSSSGSSSSSSGSSSSSSLSSSSS